MKTVYKYPVPVTDNFNLDLPKGAKVLCVQIQRGEPCVWALVDPANPVKRRSFRWAGTGHPLGDGAYAYVGTVQMEGGALVFHLFELP